MYTKITRRLGEPYYLPSEQDIKQQIDRHVRQEMDNMQLTRDHYTRALLHRELSDLRGQIDELKLELTPSPVRLPYKASKTKLYPKTELQQQLERPMQGQSALSTARSQKRQLQPKNRPRNGEDSSTPVLERQLDLVSPPKSRRISFARDVETLSDVSSGRSQSRSRGETSEATTAASDSEHSSSHTRKHKHSHRSSGASSQDSPGSPRRHSSTSSRRGRSHKQSHRHSSLRPTDTSTPMDMDQERPRPSRSHSKKPHSQPTVSSHSSKRSHSQAGATSDSDECARNSMHPSDLPSARPRAKLARKVTCRPASEYSSSSTSPEKDEIAFTPAQNKALQRMLNKSHHGQDSPSGNSSLARNDSMDLTAPALESFARTMRDYTEPPILIGNFNPTSSDWRDFHASFEITLEHYQWPAHKCFTQLASKLRGAARNLYVDRRPSSYEQLVDLMNAEFAPAQRAAQYEALYDSRVLKEGEDVHTYGRDLKSLVRKAYPDNESKQLEPFLMRRFINGLVDNDMKKQLNVLKFDTYQELIVAASRYSLYSDKKETVDQKPRVNLPHFKDRGNTRTAAAAMAYDPALRKGLQSIENRLMNMEGAVNKSFKTMPRESTRDPPRDFARNKTPDNRWNSDNRPPRRLPTCWCCRKEGHTYPRCPDNQNNQYRPTESQREWMRKARDNKAVGPPPPLSPQKSPRKEASPRAARMESELPTFQDDVDENGDQGND